MKPKALKHFSPSSLWLIWFHFVPCRMVKMLPECQLSADHLILVCLCWNVVWALTFFNNQKFSVRKCGHRIGIDVDVVNAGGWLHARATHFTSPSIDKFRIFFFARYPCNCLASTLWSSVQNVWVDINEMKWILDEGVLLFMFFSINWDCVVARSLDPSDFRRPSPFSQLEGKSPELKIRSWFVSSDIVFGRFPLGKSVGQRDIWKRSILRLVGVVFKWCTWPGNLPETSKMVRST